MLVVVERKLERFLQLRSVFANDGRTLDDDRGEELPPIVRFYGGRSRQTSKGGR